MALDINLISIIVFYSLIAVYFYINRKKITVQYKIAFLYKTKHGLNLIRKIANLNPRFWRFFGKISIPVGFAGMVFVIGILTWTLIKLFIEPSAGGGVSIVIPGVRIPGSSVFVPFWYGIIALALVLIVHEGAHGVVAESWKLKIKSAGVGLLAILPVAFVEPDEKQLQMQKTSTQLGVFAAGPFANMCLAAIVLALMVFAINPAVAGTFENKGLVVDSVNEGFPAEVAGFQKGYLVNGINGAQISGFNEFFEELKKSKPGDTVNIETSEGTIPVHTTENPEKEGLPYLGLQFRQNTVVRPDLQERFGRLPWGLLYLSRLFFWIFALNLGIGIINLLPFGPVDGGRMLSLGLNKAIKNKVVSQKVWNVMSSFSLFLLVLNIIGPYIFAAFA